MDAYKGPIFFLRGNGSPPGVILSPEGTFSDVWRHLAFTVGGGHVGTKHLTVHRTAFSASIPYDFGIRS